jgi:catechol 2,3-dioxygenase-like lactoylglutathione lyase family enzyme
MKSIPSSNAFATHASARSRSTAPPYVIHEPSEISETVRSLEPSFLRCIRSTLTASVWAVPQLNAIGIVTSDMRRSVAFYGQLGIEFPEGNGHVEATLPNGVRLMLDTEEVMRSFWPEWKRATGNQLGLALECDSPEQVDELYARVVAAGFDGDLEPWDAFWGQRYAQLSDPDGVPVSLFATL